MISGGYRFHGHNSLRFVYANGKAVRSRIATIKYVVNSRRSKSRVAVVVSKKVMKSAVGRNRIRRRIYEYMRGRLPELTNTYDIVVIVTSTDAYSYAADQLAEQFGQLLQQTEMFPMS